MSEHGETGVTVYWRPGCGYCSRLRGVLGADGEKATWVNVWEDDDASRYVKSVNEGNEVVPTVVMDGIPVTNPRPQLVLDRLRRD